MLQEVKILAQYITTKYGHKFGSRKELEDWQERKVRVLLQRILLISEFYRDYFAGLDIAEWRNWPTINKQIMIKNFTRLNTVDVSEEEAFRVAFAAEESRNFTPTVHNITVGLSSGTSGNRGLFLASQDEQAKWAGAILAKVLPGSLLKEHRIAFFLRANSNLYKTIGKHRIRFEFFDLLKPMAEHIASLNALQPTIVVGPPSLLRLLSDALCRDLRIVPEKVISVAEVLDPLDKVYLEQRFQQIIHQVYQCTEGFLGVTCSLGVLHLNEDLVVIQKEYLDDEYKRFSPIITDFSRMSQPIIRYRLDDVLKEKVGGCPCGSPHVAIESIEGRCDDIFYLPAKNQQGVIPVFPDFIRRAIITADESIVEYIAIQRNESYIDIGLRYIGCDNVEQRVRINLTTLWESMAIAPPQVNFIEIPVQIPGRKLRRVERQFEVAWKK